jgi:hypothetical protein
VALVGAFLGSTTIEAWPPAQHGQATLGCGRQRQRSCCGGHRQPLEWPAPANTLQGLQIGACQPAFGNNPPIVQPFSIEKPANYSNFPAAALNFVPTARATVS